MNAIAKLEQTALAAQDEREFIETLQSSLYPGAKVGSIKLVLTYCQHAKLDPMDKPVHIVPMNVKDAQTGKYEWRDVIMPGINNYRSKAARTGQLAGISEPEFGPMVTANLSGVDITYPEWARVVVKRLLPSGMVAEFPAKEDWIENYATAGKDTSAPNTMWRKRIMGQIGKCAEAQALRKAFPEIGAAPTAEEMEGKSLTLDDARTVDAPMQQIAAPAAEPEPWPADLFATRLPEWHKAIQDKKATADAIVAKARTKHPLTPEQEAAIRNVPKTQATDVEPKTATQQAQDDGPTFTYAQLAERVQKCKDAETAALIVDEGRALPADQYADLQALYARQFPSE
jgi:phage recombination protein Bet